MRTNIRKRIRNLIENDPSLSEDINELCAKIWIGEGFMNIEDISSATKVNTIVRARAVVVKEMKMEGVI